MDRDGVKASRCSDVRWEKHLCAENETRLTRTITQTYRSAGQLFIVYHRKKKYWICFSWSKVEQKTMMKSDRGSTSHVGQVKVLPAQQRSGNSSQKDRERLLDTPLPCPVYQSGCPLLCFHFNCYQFGGGGRKPWVPGSSGRKS